MKVETVKTYKKKFKGKLEDLSLSSNYYVMFFEEESSRTMLYTYIFYLYLFIWILFTTNLVGGGSPAISAPLYVVIRCVLI